MGVPAFFRWLSRKYPSIVVHCVEEKPKVIDGVTVPVDSSQPNPNQIEFDNLYLDMNGIIHPCCHPEDKPAPTTEDEMMVDIFAYIDRLFAIIRPRRLLYMAIDGVAPRAKMNQQRSRRFRASKESVEKQDDIERVKDEMRGRGLEVPPEKPDRVHFDSNCITPGTEFMFRLADCLRYYIYHRLNTDPAWAGITVILSDANVPGEGEHKIMDYIRRQRAQPDHDTNTKHCLCGADADLIMLGLATHEPNFTIIREEFKPNKPKTCEICGQFGLEVQQLLLVHCVKCQIGHEMKECTGAAKEKAGDHDELEQPMVEEQEFIFIRLTILREYLYQELNMSGLPFPQDLERAIDDWVLMCFFVGNDFLPHLPSLEIREGAIDRLIRLYKRAVYKTGGYLTDSGSVNLARVQLILTELGEAEDEIFKKRRSNDVEMKRRDEQRKKRQGRSAGDGPPKWTLAGQYEPSKPGGFVSPISSPRNTIADMRRSAMQQSSSAPSRTNHDAAAALKSQLAAGADETERGTKRKIGDVAAEDTQEPQDEVMLWEDGWKDRYYQSKFGVGPNDVGFRRCVANAYVLGMCWVLKYYYQGCASWDWYFPYHYAPFASDFLNIGDLDTSFDKGTKPFRPLEQLMSVFPAASKQFLPPSWQTLMDEPESPIIDFYPVDFRVDLNGKRWAWQGVALLPFVDEKRLLDTLKEVYPNLTDREQQRNILGTDRLFIGKRATSQEFLSGLYEGSPSKEDVEVNPELMFGIRGGIWCDPFVAISGTMYRSPLPQCQDFQNNGAVSVLYRDPQYDPDYVFPAKMLEGAKLPEKTLKPGDFNRRNPGESYRPQLGFTRGAGYRPSNPASAIRHIRSGVGAYSHVAPPPRAPRPRGGGPSGYGGPPTSWQFNARGQAEAYQRNQQRGYEQGYGPVRYNPNGHRYSQPASQGYGYGYRPRAVESYSTNRYAAPNAYHMNDPYRTTSYPPSSYRHH